MAKPIKGVSNVKKSMIAILVLLCILSGCGHMSVREQAVNSTTSQDDGVDVEVKTGIYQKDWSDPVGKLTDPLIPDKETAVKIATAILESIQAKGYWKTYTLHSIYFDTAEEVWLVSFGEEQDDIGALIDGGGCTIAIKKSNAEVLGVWAGE